MKLKNYILTGIVILTCLNAFAQYSKQKKADNLFNKFSFVNAAEVYHDLLNKNYNAHYATRQLADSYAFMRNADSAVVYYKKAIDQNNNIPSEYLYNYAQALRAVGDYKESRKWLKAYKKTGGKVNNDITKDGDFLSSIFNAKQQYFLTDVKLNSKYSDFGAYKNNGKIYFVSSRRIKAGFKNTYGWDGEPFLDIYSTNNITDSITPHKAKLKGCINSMYHEGPVTITKDGKTMYFSRSAFNKNTLDQTEDGTTNLKIYKASLVDGKWSNIEDLSFNNISYSNGHPALSNDESKLYFTSDMPGGNGGSDIYYVDINEDGSFSKPTNLGTTVNTNKNESFPFVNSEGILFFASDGHPGLGMLDVFGTTIDKQNNILSVINLGVPVNSNKDDFSFFMDEDGLSGFFASNREGGLGGDDIYAYDRVPQLVLEGTIIDANTNEPLNNALVTLKDVNGNKIADLVTDENGYYEINIDRDTEYVLNTKKENFVNIDQNVTTKNVKRSVSRITNNISLDPVSEEELPIEELYPIYFDFNKYDIRRDGTVELDRIVNLMLNVYPSMVIQIESHTDSRGSAKYNNKLSQERAKATYEYLVKKGVSPDRITEYKGWGKQKLVNKCDGTNNCTEEEHQLNRRTQFIVVKMK
ncbi:OmpA family protein [Seonamhaeicola marinus]|uniref:OmpA family protein n=1 Tax=Seonamhaeicola marinus TaxID=1912246 RepID=A0A5D0I8M7_9FLAO|nr:OmpA family protein [Seonamhaeicola marinus]TYA78787.1 OmpA family protein [Seonamhaeicola marinus]